MSTDTTDSDEVVCTENTNDAYLVAEVDRVDLSCLELDDSDDWLYMPPQCSTESTVQDLYAWLKMEPGLSARGNKKCIDTRTFTRPKKRSARMSFESIFEGLPRCVTNIWKPENSNVMHMENKEKYLTAAIEDNEAVPPMLKPSIKTATNALSDESSIKSGQESMEAFLNMSQSKGIDSFINLGEPEFSDPLMNVSQPSILSASIIASINDSMFVKDNVMSKVNRDAVQQVHQHSCIQEKSNFDSTNETITMRSTDDDTVTSLNGTYRLSTLNDTFCKTSAKSNAELNETYDAVSSDNITPRMSLDKEETPHTAVLSSTFTTESNVDDNSAELRSVPLSTTYLSSARGTERQDATFVRNEMHKPAAKRAGKADPSVTCEIPSNGAESAVFFEAQDTDVTFDASFKGPIRQSTPIQSNMPNLAFKLPAKHSDQPRQILYSALRAPTSLRRELLAEIQRSAEHKLNTTYNHVPNDQSECRDTKENTLVGCGENVKGETRMSSAFPSENRYDTYRKSALTTAMNQYGRSQYGETTANVQRDLTVDRKFYTFTKKNYNLVDKTDGSVERAVDKNAQVPRPNLANTFCKPLPKVPKRNSSRMLSKLPQFLQKSNPNLVSSSLRSSTNMSGSTSIFSVEYIKSSQSDMPNVEKLSLSSKLHPFGKLKSGSEQRLVEVNAKNANEFPVKGATGSTESIESTQSVQSAPDLDDRLSTCSDSSHNSCDKRTMNIEQLHQLVRMQEESLKQDAPPKPNKRRLENSWVEAKTELSSPYLKNGLEHDGEMDTHSPPSANSNIKCSSPISLTGSSHALNNEGKFENDTRKDKNKVVDVEKTEGPNQAVPKVETKTRLRQPINWGTGSKLPSVISGIPRPASRIPAFRFARPNAKTTRADVKKGCT